MKKAIVIAVLLVTSTLSTSYRVQAQVGVSVGPTLSLVKGDIPRSCSFISANELLPVPVISRLLSVLLGDSPEEVGTEIGFPPDQPYAGGVMRWTSVLEGQYIRTEVKFSNQQATARTVTMATNYHQPNEKRCSWEVKAVENQAQGNSTPIEIKSPSTPLGIYR